MTILIKSISCIITIVVLLTLYVTYKEKLTFSFDDEEVEITKLRGCGDAIPSHLSKLADSGTATSGKLWQGEIVNTYNKELLSFKKFNPKINNNNNNKPNKVIIGELPLSCNYWSVVTTIFPPTVAVIKQSKLKDWCLVVVGDRKGPESYDIPGMDKRVIFLTASYQEELSDHFPIIKNLPWNHFGRKNVGYLYAILHGAKVIYDFDDDNELLTDTDMIPIPGTNGEINSQFETLEPANFSSISFNPYLLMGVPHLPSWPRGYPLEHIKSDYSQVNLVKTNIDIDNIGIIQSLANHDPDMDAIYRLTQHIPFDFPSTGGGEGLTVAVPKTSYSPYNAQTTLHMYKSFWSLLLPCSVHGRVSDIWRGYLAQKIGFDINMRFLFSRPYVSQFRNSHNYLADFDSESDLYKRSLKLIEQLKEWKLISNTLPGRIEELWVKMYEHGYIAQTDVILVQSWLYSLIAVGYEFPKIDHL
jgi:hypothetical protein